ncbi:MAG: NAD(P)/FAD-dependent oxidoreductase [Clostridia bacterium]|nr:NAD(P)/FAD-dependent oxidoreductase [Clostridia bacterium]
MNTASTTTSRNNRIVVIGGGAAGMLAAVSARAAGAEVTLLEKNPYLGKKLNITGKGRCNVTNNCTVPEYLENVIRNPKFLMKAAYRFTPADVMGFFESAGVPLKTERGRRVFPQSDRARDVTDCLAKMIYERGIRVQRGCVTEILVTDGEVCGVKYSSDGERRRLEAASVIICTGGMSYPATGSDGSGYALARKLGHTIVTPRGSLVPLVTKEKWPGELTGLSLKNVNLTLENGGKTLFSEQGEMLFTHFGISGPLVLSGSALIDSFPCEAFIDMKPALTEETLDERIRSDFERFINKHFINSLDDLLPKAMIPHVARLSGIAPQKPVNSVTRAERRALAALLKAIPLTVTGTRPVEEAIVTAGGVNVKEIDPSTMRSKLVRGLFFAGEIIDVDCRTGGYNLQTAFCTGRLAGESAADAIQKKL